MPPATASAQSTEARVRPVGGSGGSGYGPCEWNFSRIADPELREVVDKLERSHPEVRRVLIDDALVDGGEDGVGPVLADMVRVGFVEAATSLACRLLEIQCRRPAAAWLLPRSTLRIILTLFEASRVDSECVEDASRLLGRLERWRSSLDERPLPADPSTVERWTWAKELALCGQGLPGELPAAVAHGAGTSELAAGRAGAALWAKSHSRAEQVALLKQLRPRAGKLAELLEAGFRGQGAGGSTTSPPQPIKAISAPVRSGDSGPIRRSIGQGKDTSLDKPRLSPRKSGFIMPRLTVPEVPRELLAVAISALLVVGVGLAALAILGDPAGDPAEANSRGLASPESLGRAEATVCARAGIGSAACQYARSLREALGRGPCEPIAEAALSLDASRGAADAPADEAYELLLYEARARCP